MERLISSASCDQLNVIQVVHSDSVDSEHPVLPQSMQFGNKSFGTGSLQSMQYENEIFTSGPSQSTQVGKGVNGSSSVSKF